MPYNPEETNAIVARSRAMLEQTKKEGNKPFAGSSYDTAIQNPAVGASDMQDVPFRNDSQQFAEENQGYAGENRAGGGKPNPDAYVDPITKLNESQQKDYFTQLGIATKSGKIKSSKDREDFASQFASQALGGYSPSIYTETPSTSYSRAGINSSTQGDISGAGSASTSRRYSPGMNEDEMNAEDYLSTFEQPKTAEEIEQEKIKSAQEEINSINAYYNTLLEEQGRANVKKERETNAQSVLMGLSGSTEAGGRAQEATEYGAQKNKGVLAEKTMQVNTILRQIRADAQTEAKAEKETARLSAKDILDRGDARRVKASDNVKTLAMSGVTVDGLKTGDPETYQALLKSVGDEQTLNALFVINKPQEDILDKQIIGKNYVVTSRNPITGKITTESIDLGIDIPKEWGTADLGNKIVFYNKDNLDERVEMSKGLTPSQASGGGSSLTPYQQFTATQSLSKDTQARTDKAREMVRQAQIMQTAYNNYVKGGDKNVATQAIVGTFNKVLDPTSVVREGEYDRTAKGQSLIGQIEGKARNIVEGGNITPATLKSAVDLTNEYLKGAQDNIIQQNKRAEQMATQFGLNPSFVSSTGQEEQPQGGNTQSNFSDIESKMRVEGNTVYIPRSIWNTLGAKKDALLAEVKADGGKLLVE